MSETLSVTVLTSADHWCPLAHLIPLLSTVAMSTTELTITPLCMVRWLPVMCGTSTASMVTSHWCKVSRLVYCCTCRYHVVPVVMVLPLPIILQLVTWRHNAQCSTQQTLTWLSCVRIPPWMWSCRIVTLTWIQSASTGRTRSLFVRQVLLNAVMWNMKVALWSTVHMCELMSGHVQVYVVANTYTLNIYDVCSLLFMWKYHTHIFICKCLCSCICKTLLQKLLLSTSFGTTYALFNLIWSE